MRTNRGGNPYQSVMVEFDQREKTKTAFVDWVVLLGMRSQVRGTVLTQACISFKKLINPVYFSENFCELT
jgi:hypothetical protein